MAIDNFIRTELTLLDYEIESIDLYDNNIISQSLNIIQILQKSLSKIREFVLINSFQSNEEEIIFFKEQKPEILSRLLFFNKIYQIESKFPNGSNSVASKYIVNELDSLTFFFNRNLDFYQYYRSKSTIYDSYYFLRDKADLRLASDSAYFNCDTSFSTGYDYKIAKILANEMLRIYLNKRLMNLNQDNSNDIDDKKTMHLKSTMIFTGKKVWLIELGYALANSGDINNKTMEIKEVMDLLGNMFNVDLGDYYRTYISIKDRKKDRTIYLNKLIEILEKKMDEDDSY